MPPSLKSTVVTFMFPPASELLMTTGSCTATRVFRRRSLFINARAARKLELTSRLERDRAAAGHVVEADDVVALHDRLPAQQMPHSVEQCLDAAWPRVGHRVMAFEGERELFVFGTDAKMFERLRPGLEPRDKRVARFNGRHVDLIASHAGSGGNGARPYTGLARKSNARAVSRIPALRAREHRTMRRVAGGPAPAELAK